MTTLFSEVLLSHFTEEKGSPERSRSLPRSFSIGRGSLALESVLQPLLCPCLSVPSGASAVRVAVPWRWLGPNFLSMCLLQCPEQLRGRS